MSRSLPLVFACSGCSLAGRLAYDLAQDLDRRDIAEMSCLAGVGAGKPHFLNQLRDREVWVIDGCPVQCGLGVFEQVQRSVDAHIRLDDFGVRKTSGAAKGLDINQLMDATLQQVSALGALMHRRSPVQDGGDDSITKSVARNVLDHSINNNNSLLEKCSEDAAVTGVV